MDINPYYYQNYYQRANQVAIRTTNGVYVSAETSGQLVANRGRIGPWETFTLVSSPLGGTAFRSYHGLYICAESAGADALVANRNWIGPWETFSLIPLPEKGPNYYAIKAVNGNFVSAEAGGGTQLKANRGWVGPWETFELVPL
ncbi:hypothetical protein COM81_27825 [Priestia megaterium]|uniref:fascin domain-containing protein n=1 Tax=Priestia megaterium TaxID=1404 RepID=UPI000BEE3508|nr:hypothetical protein [Priestia megaterium]PEE73601.1 hypothetical protein COM81_27825 [Priestia megaterium]